MKRQYSLQLEIASSKRKEAMKAKQQGIVLNPQRTHSTYLITEAHIALQKARNLRAQFQMD